MHPFVSCDKYTDFVQKHQKRIIFFIFYIKLDCFVPRNEDACSRHCEERSNPEDLTIIHFFISSFSFYNEKS